MSSTTPTIKTWRPTLSRTGRAHYDFDVLRHGDAIEVVSKPSASEMFRRWKRVTGRQAQLVSSQEYPQIMFFLDESPV